MEQRTEKGFTLTELLTTLAIVSIVGLFSISPISRLVEKNKVDADISTLINIINTARNKAISQKDYIVICGDSETKDCSRNWQNIKVINKTDKTLLHQAQLNTNFNSIRWYAFQNKPGLTIAPTGFTHHQNGSLYLCNKIPELSRAIAVSKSGRIKVHADTAKIADRCHS